MVREEWERRCKVIEEGRCEELSIGSRRGKERRRLLGIGVEREEEDVECREMSAVVAGSEEGRTARQRRRRRRVAAAGPKLDVDDLAGTRRSCWACQVVAVEGCSPSCPAVEHS